MERATLTVLPQIRYNDGEEQEELLPMERVELPSHQEGGAAWPEPSAEQLYALGVYLLLKVDEAEAKQAAASVGTSRSRSRPSEGRLLGY